MTTYLAGKRIRGTNAEKTSLTVGNIQDGSVFEETDTNKHYILSSGSWTEL